MKKLASCMASMPINGIFFSFFLLFSISANAQADQGPGRVAAKVDALKKKGAFNKGINLFTISQIQVDNEISSIVKKYSLLDLQSIEEIQRTQPSYINFNVPVDNGSRQLHVFLYKESISPNGFTLLSNGNTRSQQQIVHYRGSIDNDLHSVAAFSFSDNEVAGLINNNEGNYVIGKVNNGNSKHIIYNDRDLVQHAAFNCATNTFIPVAPAELARPEATAAVASKCVNWYWETDYDMFVNKGSVANVNAYMQGVFNQMATLYANDGITVTLKTLYVWSAEDPYTGPTTSDYLNQFGTYRTSFDGDLGHLIGLKGSGGIAWIKGVCKTTKYKMAYSGISSSYKAVPSYSWSVECITHEQGHLLGSPHTHDCSWNGNNTKIDGCGDAAGYTSGTCTTAAVPTGGGTIMSYCHLTSAGINFNLGFGPQPTALMISTINAASCLTTCTSCAVPVQPAAITGSGTVCQGSSQTYSIAAVSGATSYTWTLPSGWTGLSTSNTITVTTATAGGTISVSANNSCGSSPAQNLNTTVTTLPAQPGIIIGNTAICAGTVQTYSVAAVSGAASYTWTLPSGWTGSSTNNTINATTTAAGGTISVKTNNNCGSSLVRTTSVTITANAPVQPASIAGNTAICVGSVQAYSVPAVAGASVYTWTLPSGWTGSSTSNAINVTAGNTPGTIAVTAGNGCGTSVAKTLAITINPLPAIPGGITVSGGVATVCSGDTRTYTVPLVTGVTYNWTVPAGSTIATGQGTNSIKLSFSSSFVSGSTLTVKAVNNCGSSASRSLTILKNSISRPGSISVGGGSSRVCPGDIRTYWVSTVTGITYKWTAPSGATITSGQGTNSINITYSSSFISQGTLSVTANNNCGTSSARTLTISRNTLSRPSSLTGVTTVCPGAVSSYKASTVPGASSYLWTVPNGAVIQGTSIGTSILVVWGSTGGSVTVRAVNACGNSSSRSLSVSTNCTSGMTDILGTEPIVYPNPARGKVMLRFGAIDHTYYTMHIIDITGRIIRTESVSANRGVNIHTIDIAGFAKGTYMISIQDKAGKKVLRFNVE